MTFPMFETWVVRGAAGLALLVIVWRTFRFSMGLRYTKVLREEARRVEEDRGRRVVAEIPSPTGELVLFVEDADGFRWDARSVRRTDVAGARLLLSGALVASAVRLAPLPELPMRSPDDGREHWQVVIYRADGSTAVVECGSYREGVSREIAARVFEAVAADARAGVGCPAGGERP